MKQPLPQDTRGRNLHASAVSLLSLPVQLRPLGTRTTQPLFKWEADDLAPSQQELSEDQKELTAGVFAVDIHGKKKKD
jgi:hypothetical protein